MPYAIRTTENPEYDTIRNWCGWMGEEYSSEISALESVLLNSTGIDAQEAFENAILRGKADEGDYESFLRDLADDNGVDVRYHEICKKWLHVHHDGLSVYILDAETETEARAEGLELSAHVSGEGQKTIGEVRHLGVLLEDQNTHLFWCEDWGNE